MPMLKKFVSNAYLNLIIGILFLYSGISETWHELQVAEEIHIGSHHGVILFALLHILKILPDLFEGLEYINNAEEKINDK